MDQIKLPFYAKLALVLLSIALIVLFMYFGKSVFIPLFFAFLIAALLHPVVARLEKISFPRSLASFLAVLLFLAFLAGLIYFFSHQVIRFSRDLPHLQKKFTSKLQNIQSWIAENYNVNDSAQINYISKSANTLAESAAGSIANTFIGAVKLVVLGIFLLIFTFFILFHRQRILQFIVELFTASHKERVMGVVTQVHRMVHNYVLGLLMEMLILGTLIFLTLKLIGIKYALLIAVMAAILNIIPYLGIYAALFISMLITLSTGNASQLVSLGVVFIVTHFIDANIILPRIVGGQVKLNPLITILAVLFGNLIWGIPGMFLFIPMIAILRIISEEVDGLKPYAILLGAPKKERIKERDSGKLKPDESDSREGH
jgi:predicted PurR-regulated permease PerM